MRKRLKKWALSLFFKMVKTTKEKKVAEAVREAILKGQQLKMTVKTESMHPLLKRGDNVIVKKCAYDNLRCGDIILYMIDYVSYVHRLIFKNKKGNQLFLITKPDKALFFNTPISSSKLAGKVIAVEKDRSYINLEGALWKVINRCLGLFSFLEGNICNVLRLVKRRIMRQLSSSGFSPKGFLI